MKATARKQPIIAATITSVCMAFRCIAAVHDGYEVFAVVHASGSYSKRAGSTVVESPGSHAIHVSRPADVALLIKKAAQAKLVRDAAAGCVSRRQFTPDE